MTSEEKARWEQRRQDAKAKLAEIAPIRAELKRLTESYDRIYVRQYMKFAEADERLAMTDGRFKKIATGVSSKGPRKLSEYSPEELLRAMNNSQLLRLQELIKAEREKESEKEEDKK